LFYNTLIIVAHKIRKSVFCFFRLRSDKRIHNKKKNEERKKKRINERKETKCKDHKFLDFWLNPQS
jgi:hypothetical protein